MLRQMRGRAFELARQLERQGQAPIGQVEIELAGARLVDALAVAPDLRGEEFGDVLGQAQGLADVADGALGVIAHDGRAECAVIAAVGIIISSDRHIPDIML
jgi:hypothetical protein